MKKILNSKPGNPLSSFKAWKLFCKKNRVSPPEAALYYLKNLKKSTDEEINASIISFKKTWDTLIKKIHTEKFTTPSGLITGIGPGLLEATKDAGFIYKAAVATAVMEATSSGRIPIIAAFTCGAAGTFPAILFDFFSNNSLSFTELKDVFLVSFGVGIIAKELSSISGAIGLCSAETGNSAAAAAAGRVWHLTKDMNKTFKTVEVIIERTQGIPCDPICGGLVELPCNTRNGNATIVALMTADEVISDFKMTTANPDMQLQQQKKNGNAAPHTLKETSLGGTAATAGAIKYYLKNVKNKIPADLKNIIHN
jgi:L-serine deaminase